MMAGHEATNAFTKGWNCGLVLMPWRRPEVAVSEARRWEMVKIRGLRVRSPQPLSAFNRPKVLAGRDKLLA